MAKRKPVVCRNQMEATLLKAAWAMEDQASAVEDQARAQRDLVRAKEQMSPNLRREITGHVMALTQDAADDIAAREAERVERQREQEVEQEEREAEQDRAEAKASRDRFEAAPSGLIVDGEFAVPWLVIYVACNNRPYESTPKLPRVNVAVANKKEKSLAVIAFKTAEYIGTATLQMDGINIKTDSVNVFVPWEVAKEAHLLRREHDCDVLTDKVRWEDNWLKWKCLGNPKCVSDDCETHIQRE